MKQTIEFFFDGNPINKNQKNLIDRNVAIGNRNLLDWIGLASLVVTASNYYALIIHSSKQEMTVIYSFRISRGPKSVAAGRVEQVTAIHRFNIMENKMGLFLGGRYIEWAL